MTTLLRVLQEHGAAAAEHGADEVQQGVEQAVEHGAEAAHAAAEGVPDIGGMLMHHLADAQYLELTFIGEVQLPHWEPLHLAGLTIDFSPTKHVVFMP